MTADVATSGAGTGRDAPARQPLVLAAVVFFTGVAVGRAAGWGATGWVAGAGIFLLAWLVMEWIGWERAAGALLMAAIGLAGAGLWAVNQDAVGPMDVARFAADEERAVTLRARVVVPPESSDPSAGGGRWVAEATEILTDHGWRMAGGRVLIASHGASVHADDRVEIYGWLSRPEPANNPGAPDRRAMLAADRIFAAVRVPRASGIVMLEAGDHGANFLARLRRAAAEKLLQHVVLEDVPAAYTLSALLLGQRDANISDVSQNFSDAGVAHLLAISGSHVVFFTGLVWAVLRFLPVRPRVRDVLIALILVAYILATPMGPPIVRAGVALLLVLLARMLGRPAQHLNTLAAAAILVVIWRPADIVSAGFQLSFVATAGLIVFGPRLYHYLFDRWLEREKMVVELSQSTWARRRLRMIQTLLALVTANIIGAAVAAPLVALHFGQVNPWGVAAGLVAMPFVVAAMALAALQFLAEMVWSGLAQMMVPVSTWIGHGVIWVVAQLAALPGAALAVRPPPGWVVLVLYAGLVAWAVRRRLGLSRAAALNICVAALVVMAGWCVWSLPAGSMQITVLDAGTASSILLRVPGGRIWVINAGVPRGSDMATLLRPALRVAGTRRVEGLIVGELDGDHAGGAAELAALARPRAVIAAEPVWSKRHETLAGEALDGALNTNGIPAVAVHAGQAIDLGAGARVEILWPVADAGVPLRGDLIVQCTFGEQRVLILNPAAEGSLMQVIRGNPDLRCAAVIFTGARGADDGTLRQQCAALGANTLVWNGRATWAPLRLEAGELDTRNGAVILDMDEKHVGVSQ